MAGECVDDFDGLWDGEAGTPLLRSLVRAWNSGSTRMSDDVETGVKCSRCGPRDVGQYPPLTRLFR